MGELFPMTWCRDTVWSGVPIFVNKNLKLILSPTLEWGLGCSMLMVYYDALILIEPSAIMSNKTAADHIWVWLSFYSLFLPFFCLSVYFEGFNLFLFINLWFCHSLLVTFALPLIWVNLLYFWNWMQVVPCAVLALLIHPSTSHHLLNRISWAFCVYLEAVSVLPQLRVMQNTKVLFLNLRISVQHFVYGIWFYFSVSFDTFRLLNLSQLIMYLHWVLQDSWAALIGFFRFVHENSKMH